MVLDLSKNPWLQRLVMLDTNLADKVESRMVVA